MSEHTRLLFAPGDLRAEGVDDASLVAAIGEVESAWVQAQAATGLISAEVRAEAVTGIEATVRELTGDTAALTTLAEDAESGGNPVIPFVTAVRYRLAPAAARIVHRGLTSQDVMDSALGILIGRAFARIDADLEAITATLVTLSENHARTLCLARTLTQPALPTTFGLRAATWAAEAEEIRRGTPQPATLQVGGAAGTRAAIREFAGKATMTLLREFAIAVGGPDAALTPVPTPWHTDRIRVLTWAGHLAACVALGSTIARTVLIGTRPEVGELRLSATGASSAMPQKANPTSAVLLHRNGMRAPGALATVTTAAAEAVEERSDGAWHAEWAPLAELMVLALSSLSLLEDMVAGLSVEAETMRRNLDAASPGIYGERLTTAFGDRLTKTQIQEIIVPGGDPSARLAAALADTPGDTPPRAELEGFFAPEDYLGEAEDIRQTIISTITDHPADPAL
ncbi:lyase family protein [Brevibacterium casei]